MPTSRPDVMVDRNILPLIEYLWAHGINTLFCCEGGRVEEGGRNPTAYVSFENGQDAEFLASIFEELGYTIYRDRIIWSDDMKSAKAIDCFDPVDPRLIKVRFTTYNHKVGASLRFTRNARIKILRKIGCVVSDDGKIDYSSLPAGLSS